MPRPKFTHRLEYGAYRLIESGLRLLSVRTTVSLGEFLGRIAFHILPKYRHIVLRNLRFAFSDEKSPTEINDLLHEVFERNGGNLLSSIRLPFLDDDELRQHVTFENVDLIDKVYAEERGTLTIVPHMGNWEMLAQGLPMIQPQGTVGAFYRRLNNPLMDRLIEKRRSRRGVHLFAKHSSSHKLTSFLRENGILGILGDQRIPSRGHAALFFGRPTTFSPLPELLAKRTGAGLVGMHCRSSGEDQWTVTFTEIADASAQSCASNLEKAWRSSPADVFWFQDRWRMTGQNPLSFLEKMDPSLTVSKPLRIVSTKALEVPEKLASVEIIDLDFDEPTSAIEAQLQALNDTGGYPVDLYLCPEKFVVKLRKLTERTLVVAHEAITA